MPAFSTRHLNRAAPYSSPAFPFPLQNKEGTCRIPSLSRTSTLKFPYTPRVFVLFPRVGCFPIYMFDVLFIMNFLALILNF